MSEKNDRLPVVRPPLSPHRFEPRDCTELMKFCNVIHKSGLCPKSVRSPEQAFIMASFGAELGLTVMQSFRMVYVVDGQPSCSAALKVGLCKRRPEVCRYFRHIETTDQSSTWETHRSGEPEPTRYTYTMDDAQKAGLLGKNNWKRYPKNMLRARASSELASMVYQDIVGGLYTADELGSEVAEDVREVEANVIPDSGSEPQAPPPVSPGRSEKSKIVASIMEELSSCPEELREEQVLGCSGGRFGMRSLTNPAEWPSPQALGACLGKLRSRSGAMS